MPSGTVQLLSSGRDASDSWFLDASASGDDAFFVTRERLVGWDTDSAYDLYDARVGGGLPRAAAPPAPSCDGDACRGVGHAAPPVGERSASARVRQWREAVGAGGAAEPRSQSELQTRIREEESPRAGSAACGGRGRARAQRRRR